MPYRFSAPAALVSVSLALSACTSAGPPRLYPAPAPAPAAEPLLGEGPGLVDEAPSPARRDLLGNVAYDLPVESNRWVEAEVDFLVGQRRDVIARWMERGDYYEPFVRSVLKAYRVPSDLVYLGMIESAFLPTARSRAGAVGLWQFMGGTARALGLRVDSLVDERMDPVRSTRAAARHLAGLRDEMGDWALAAAAYNAGTGRIRRGLTSFGASTYWELASIGDLAEETRHYVPRLYAMAIIARRREAFGFAPAVPGAGFAYDSIQVEYATPLPELVKLGGGSADELARLNPHLLRGETPGGGYWVWVPAGRGMELQRAWFGSEYRKRRSGALAAVATTRGAPAPAEKKSPESRPVAGDGSRAAAGKTGAGSGASRRHVVQPGETLWAIARRYGTTVGAIQGANELAARTIQPGMKLTIPT